MKLGLGLGVVAVVGVLTSGCAEMTQPGCYGDIFAVSEEDDPEAFDRAFMFETRVTIQDGFGSPPETGEVTVADVTAMERESDSPCMTDIDTTTASVQVELESGEELFVPLQATIKLSDDGESKIEFGGSTTYDPSMRIPYTPQEKWRISAVHVYPGTNTFTLEAQLTPDVCEDALDCEHNKFSDVLTFEVS